MSNQKRLEDFTKEELHAALRQAVEYLQFERTAIARMGWFSHSLNLSSGEVDDCTRWYRAMCAEHPEWLEDLCRHDSNPNISRWDPGEYEPSVKPPAVVTAWMHKT